MSAPDAARAPGALVEHRLAVVWRAALAVAGEADLAEEAACATLAAAVGGAAAPTADALAAASGAHALALLRRERGRGRLAPAPPYDAVGQDADADALRAVAGLDALPRAAVGLALLAGLGPAVVAAALALPERGAAVHVRSGLDAVRARLGEVPGVPLELRLRRAGEALAPAPPSAASRVLRAAVAAARDAGGDGLAVAALPVGRVVALDLVRPARPLPRALRRAGLAVAGAALLAGVAVAVLDRRSAPHARAPRAAAAPRRAGPAPAPVLRIVAPIAPGAVRVALHGATPREARVAREVLARLGEGAPVRAFRFEGSTHDRVAIGMPEGRGPFAAVAAAAATAGLVSRLAAEGERISTVGASGAVDDVALLAHGRPPPAAAVDLARRVAARAQALALHVDRVTVYPLGLVRIEAQPDTAAWFGETRRGWLASLLAGDGAPATVDFELRAPDGTPMAQAVVAQNASAYCDCPPDGPVPDTAPPPGPAGPTRLAIDVATRALPDAARRATVDCDRGRVTGVSGDAASICARIDRDRYRLLAPDSLDAATCPGAFGTPRALITGTYRGIPVARSYGSCGGDEAGLWRAVLAPLPARGRVPAVAGHPLRDAVQRLVAAGLTPRLAGLPALGAGPACPDLLVATASRPAAGASVARGAAVTVRLAPAPRRCPPAGPTAIFGRVDLRAPDVRGLDLDAALARLAASGLRAAVASAAASAVPPRVRSQEPPAATTLHAGSVVLLRAR